MLRKLAGKVYRKLRHVVRDPLEAWLVRFRFRHAALHPTAHVHLSSSLTEHTRIGPYSRINGPCTVRGEGPVTIGNWCAIGHELWVVSANHAIDTANVELRLDRALKIPGPRVDFRGGVNIGHSVWVGDRVTLVAGAKIGNGAVVGAGSIVTKEIPPYAIAAGVPARVLKYRFSPEIIAALQELQWWDWPWSKIQQNRDFFAADLTQISVDELRRLVR